MKEPYADEPKVELNQDLWEQYQQARTAREGWEKIEKKLKAELEAELGDAWAGTVDGQKVVTRRPSDKWAEQRLRNDYPDLTRQFVREKIQEVFDVALFVKSFPEIADQYRVRQFRIVTE